MQVWLAVRADDAVARGHDALFGQERVLNAHLADVVEVEDVVLVCELAALLGLGRTLDVLVGDKVVEHDVDAGLVKDGIKARLVELIDGHRGRNIVAEHDVEPSVDELAAVTAASPQWAAKIFWVMVMPMVVYLRFVFFGFPLGGRQGNGYLLLIALTRALMPATIISVWVPQPQVSSPEAHFRPT